MLVGRLLQNKASEELLHTLAFAIFAVFGVYTLFQGMNILLADGKSLAIGITAAVAVIFAIVCFVLYRKNAAKQPQK